MRQVWYSVSHLLFSSMFLYYKAGWTICAFIILQVITSFTSFPCKTGATVFSGSLFHYSYYVFLSLLGNNPTCFEVECLVMAYKILAESALLVSTEALCYFYYCPISHSLMDFSVSLPFLAAPVHWIKAFTGLQRHVSFLQNW